MYRCLGWCSNSVLAMARLLLLQNSRRSDPLSFSSPNPNFPLHSLFHIFFPTLGLKSPDINFISVFGMLSIVSCSVL